MLGRSRASSSRFLLSRWESMILSCYALSTWRIYMQGSQETLPLPINFSEKKYERRKHNPLLMHSYLDPPPKYTVFWMLTNQNNTIRPCARCSFQKKKVFKLLTSKSTRCTSIYKLHLPHFHLTKSCSLVRVHAALISAPKWQVPSHKKVIRKLYMCSLLTTIDTSLAPLHSCNFQRCKHFSCLFWFIHHKYSVVVNVACEHTANIGMRVIGKLRVSHRKKVVSMVRYKPPFCPGWCLSSLLGIAGNSAMLLRA
jgi:hypothetical protein